MQRSRDQMKPGAVSGPEQHENRILFLCGGGTAGHVLPLLSVAQWIRDHTASETLRILWFTDRRGEKIARTLNVPLPVDQIIRVRLHGWRRNRWWKNLDLPFLLTGALMRVWYTWIREILRFGRFSAVIFGTGSYIQVPVALVLGKQFPLILYEPNRKAGLGTRMLQKMATHICVFLPVEDLPLEKQIQTGVPLRSQFLTQVRDMSSRDARKRLGLPPDNPVLLITGGSLGSAYLNAFVQQYADRFLQNGVSIIWQTGSQYHVPTPPVKQGSARMRVVPHLPEMGVAMRSATVVVARGGATTLAEILCAGACAVVVPASTVADQHQYASAKFLSEQGALVMVPEEAGPEILFQTISSLLKDSERRQQIQTTARSLAHCNATERIGKLLLQWLKDPNCRKLSSSVELEEQA